MSNIYTVSDLTKYIKNLLDRDTRLMSVFIKGELSNFKAHYSGHCYFTLKDAGSQIKGVMFKSRAQFLKFEPRDGLKVVAYGQVTVFERDGQYQLYADQLIPDGVGELSLAFNQLKEKLAAEGLFDESRKQQLPLIPQAIGVITSPTGAALRDIITVAKRRHPGIPLILYPVQVQGLEAPGQIVEAIRAFNRLQNVEVIIAGRGGGSIEELWAFNDEQVVRAIAASSIPIVSAVGHQTDYTLADFAADSRAATPSQAAEMVVPDVYELKRYIQTLQTMLENTMRTYIKQRRQAVCQLRDNRVFTQPEKLLAEHRQLVDSYVERLEQAARNSILTKQQQLKLHAEKLAVLNPLAVLARGFSLTRTPAGQVISAANQVKPGQQLEIILNHGRLEVEVACVRESKNGY
ncbi:exodeoxyribonuclease VII large subunit [Sporomusa sphaeroides]|uniref:Exodeoxyribonuclease 7 large subunit n=1 Tax=Sporomusa sphaeroides DSM 2875 TaxID=1337886 RepID=A0ABP2C7N3_9FIRM|nr:exodeoxyribonuclease VII large subunit [Sporomusa sphaeroides]OLS58506.1 exodeoxyribonuclease 7 large subunit [Sporomusa sphaeroides DSM 2875]CVK19646.1 Exodeoxyribonuclease 7 large subunit [Sporomusa sphaeroides DSM 2875]